MKSAMPFRSAAVNLLPVLASAQNRIDVCLCRGNRQNASTGADCIEDLTRQYPGLSQGGISVCYPCNDESQI